MKSVRTRRGTPRRFMALGVLLLSVFPVTVGPARADGGVTTTVHTLIGAGAPFTDGLSLDPAGNLYASDALGPGSLSNPQGTTVVRITPDLQITPWATGLAIPMGNVLDDAGNLYVANWAGPVRRITPGGVSTVLSPTTGAGLAMDSAGYLYLSKPSSLSAQNRIMKIAPDGTTTTYFSGPPLQVTIGLAIDDLDNLYAANFHNGRIYRIAPADSTTAQLIATIPGAVSSSVGFLTWHGGYLYCPGYSLSRVYRVDVATGEVIVLAGTGVAGLVDGPGDTAQFDQPNGCAMSASGDTLFVTDDVDRSLRIIVISEEATDAPAAATPGGEGLRLLARPCPFRTETNITYEIPRAAPVRLEIHDLQGRRVRSLHAGFASAGRHTVTWDGTDDRGRPAMSGVYFYRLATGGSSVTRRLVRTR